MDLDNYRLVSLGDVTYLRLKLTLEGLVTTGVTSTRIIITLIRLGTLTSYSESENR
jgi:hypothetical protein